nr:2-oxo acid dehydrogenase subunit E2 [Mycoplasmopsis bovis]
MAVDTPFGLFVPVIRGVENLSIIEIQKEIVRLSTLAREKKLKMSDMTGGLLCYYKRW